MSTTSTPRARPSVESMATARTRSSPRCCCTSATSVPLGTRDLEGGQDLGKVLREDGVDHDALDLDDLAGVPAGLLVGHCSPRKRRRLIQPHAPTVRRLGALESSSGRRAVSGQPACMPGRSGVPRAGAPTVLASDASLRPRRNLCVSRLVSAPLASMTSTRSACGTSLCGWRCPKLATANATPPRTAAEATTASAIERGIGRWRRRCRRSADRGRSTASGSASRSSRVKLSPWQRTHDTQSSARDAARARARRARTARRPPTARRRSGIDDMSEFAPVFGSRRHISEPVSGRRRSCLRRAAPSGRLRCRP